MIFISCSEDSAGPVYGNKVGFKAYNFSQNSPDGEPVQLSDYEGKVVLLDFWATWCGPCVAGVYDLKFIWNEYKEQDFIIISVSLDKDEQQWRDFIRERDMDWIHTFDGNVWDNAVASLYQINVIPTVMIIDRKGIIRYSGFPIVDILDGEIEKYLYE